MPKLHLFALFLMLSAPAAMAEPVVVLIPGAGSSGPKMWLGNLQEWLFPVFGGNKYFGGIQRELKKKKIRHFVCPETEDGDTRNIGDRADECVRQIVQDQGSCAPHLKREVHVLGHSMGGLVARVVARDRRASACIKTVTTVATPHKGSPLADFVIEHVEAGDLWGHLALLAQFDPRRALYIRELRVDRSAEPPGTFYAQDIPNNPAVKYYSFSDSMRRIPFVFFEITRKIVSDEIRRRGLDNTPFGDANDGIVPEYSMVHGKYLGHIDSWHWASACHDPIRRYRSCKNAKKQIIPHLEKLYFNTR